MNENLNLVEILKDCPSGTKLYSTVFGEVEFDHIVKSSTEYPIEIKLESFSGREYLTTEGKLCAKYNGECILFPSREQRDWSKFKVKKPKFDQKTLMPFDKVIVRLENQTFWTVDFFSFLGYKDIKCIGGYFNRCVPYNDDTKHLVGTTEEAPEFYRYWED